MESPIQRNEPNTFVVKGIKRWAVQMIASLLIFGLLLFVLAGKWTWTAGWVYLGMNAITQLLSAIVLIPRQAEMLSERSKVREGTKGWDRVLAPAIVIVGTLAVLTTAALDARFGWSRPVDVGLCGFGVVLAFTSQMFVLWAMASNPFFAATVRIQEDRGHKVTTSGPYQFVRHPGYSGSLLYTLLVPLVLRSWWTFFPALMTVALIVIRTRLEDQTLQAELPGYKEYTSRVQYRLIPGIW
ncbi:MAG TPA: isoprenylcysteine carboxylmethyltransferase family protein [Anaerolineales bacterium]|nr:isoprenylcysteine carboxylmethyltransferase family protein [Anaerolineales bacterium]